MEISHKYKSLKSLEINSIKLELFEWCGKYHVRLHGVAENFIDVYIGVDKNLANGVYQAQYGVLMLQIITLR